MNEFLSNCHKIEMNASKTYKLLAQNEAYPKKLRHVFLELSNDENGHARSIDLALQANHKELDANPLIAWEKIIEAVELSEKFLKRVQQSTFDEEKALRLSVEMEQVFLKVHVQNALHFGDHRVKNLFQSLEEEDQKHINKLKDCLRWWHLERKPYL